MLLPFSIICFWRLSSIAVITWSIFTPFTVSFIKTASNIKAKPIEWLWPGVIPRGCLTLIAGAAGMGKSQVAISIAARVTSEGGRALIMEAEDDAGSVVLPRLKAAGADIKKCAIGSLVDLSGGIKTLTATAKKLGGVRLVVLSPIRAFFKAAEDHGNVGVRKALAPLLTWAEREGATIVGIGHPPKGRRDPFAGSAAYVELLGNCRGNADKLPVLDLPEACFRLTVIDL